MFSQLTDAVRERLPREVYVCGPGVQQLVPLDDDGDRPAILVGLPG